MDNASQYLTGIPTDYSKSNILTFLLTYTNNANAPTVFYYDNYGYMRPNPDAPTSTEAQIWMDSYNENLTRFKQTEKTQLDEYFKTLFPLTFTPVISPTLGTTPDPLVKTIVYVDPLVLDLDGDGLEITPLSKGILFDANGDAVKTGTAWVGADDGLLVWDRNGNGTIDTGAELFGDETVLANGQKAAHGFAALSELDTGSLVNGVRVGAGDGVFDAKDAQYNTLRTCATSTKTASAKPMNCKPWRKAA